MDAIKKILPIITVAIMGFASLTTLAELGYGLNWTFSETCTKVLLAEVCVGNVLKRYFFPGFVVIAYVLFFSILTLLANLPVEAVKEKVTGVFTMYKSKRALAYYVALPLFALHIGIPVTYFHLDTSGETEVLGVEISVDNAHDNTAAWIFIITTTLSFIGVIFLAVVETLNKGNE
jgi:hypothetical protein